MAMGQGIAAAPVAVSNSIVESFLKRRNLGAQDLLYLMHPDVSHQHDPFLLKGVGRWIDALHRVKGLPVAIIPDYDADGVLSGTLARVGLSLFGFGDAYLYPPKTSDGYGLSQTSVDNVLMARPDIKVIITTDNGSNAHEGVSYAKSKGLTVLITDHHLAGEAPCADAAINPNGHGDNTYPFTHISGTAVIYKALMAYGRKYITDASLMRDFRSLVLLVGISTISDVMPLLNENRYYVTESVRMLEHFIEGYSVERLLGYDDTPLHQYYRGVDLLVTTLYKNGKLKYGVDAETFGFVIGPILNSPRRMTGESALSFQLFQSKRCDLADSAQMLPGDLLYTINEQRKVYVRSLTAALFSHIEKGGRLPVEFMTPNARRSPVEFMVFNARMNKGVAGLLSGNFTQAFGLPSIAFGAGSGGMIDGGEGDIINVDVSEKPFLVGSARSPESFDLHGFLTVIDAEHPGLIHKWGGHAQAAGITIRGENYERFRSVFINAYMTVMLEHLSAQGEPEGASVFGGEYILTTELFDRMMEAGVAHESEVIPLHGHTSVFTNQALWEAVRFFEQLEPFGQGFPKPSFSVAIAMSDVPRVFTMGADKQHAKLMLNNGLTVIHWNGADQFKAPSSETGPDNRVFVVTGSLGINRFNGDESLQLIAESVQELG
ncbi:DHH family phosphoesterase [Metabacillus sp. SLBN-84]